MVLRWMWDDMGVSRWCHDGNVQDELCLGWLTWRYAMWIVFRVRRGD